MAVQRTAEYGSNLLWQAYDRVTHTLAHTFAFDSDSEEQDGFLDTQDRASYDLYTTPSGYSLLELGDRSHSYAEHDKNRDANRQADDLARLAEASTTEPAAMLRGDYDPELSEDSAILDRQNFAALANTVPIRHKWARWQLLYSSGRDGISLATLYRHAGKCPSVLVVRDMQQYVFGCYTSESWRIQPRYYGNGECFAFQIQPRAVFWRWWAKRMAVARNDYFQFSLPERLCLGGAPRYALSLDADLQYGSSGMSDTFGSPCLASNEDFEVGRVELWGLQ